MKLRINFRIIDGKTSLYIAALILNLQVVEIFAHNDADINSYNCEWYTLLFAEYIVNHKDIADYLINSGADVFYLITDYLINS